MASAPYACSRPGLTSVPPPRGSAIYYLDCSAEQNGNGTQASPWKSPARVNGLTSLPGDHLLLKRGTVTVRAFLVFGDVMLMDIAGAWQQSAADQKLRVQNLLFQGGLHYSQENRDFRHPKPCLFNVMHEMTGNNWWFGVPDGI
jgi:hypothetical protein